MVYKFFDKKLLLGILKMRIHQASNLQKNYTNQLVENYTYLQRKKSTLIYKERKVHLSFIRNVWGLNLAEVQLITKFNKRFKFLLCVIGWFIPLKDKKVLTITNAFLNVLDESNRKPNKIWVDKDSEFFDT